ncbi:class I adenylate-forming enzyme family protein [Mycolicibacter senuensis]|uniref:class I adenylate-forming enzyme family protein n=1 Tax=Mycolicibacter senuensis TaxID=386913 RepID=UPI000DCD6015|nr:class I adenylate-forming enzyme family protein [Mycolicibacter senuensis]RAV03977.1 long-chain fatty acid--CoA ligase [Mycolicibacter senuensis]
MTWLHQIIAVHADSDRPAVVDDASAVSGRDLIRRAVHASDLLTGLALPADCPVPALLTNNADALALLLGGMAAGTPLAPLGPRLTADELAPAVSDSGSPVLLTEPAFLATAQAVAEVAGVRVVALTGLSVSDTPLASAPAGPAFYLHTSGTTGLPKRVAFTQPVLESRAEVLRELIAIGPNHRYATGSPIHHIGGLGNTLVALHAGATIIATQRFSVDWWRSLHRLEATHCLLVPSMIEMLLAENLLDAVPLRTLIYGASPISPATLHRVLHALPEVGLVNLFGQTEGSPITCLSPQDHRRAADGQTQLLRTIGRPVPGLRLRIESPDESGTGELLAAAAHLSVHGADGWLHTGDLGAVDAEGYVHLRGRRHDMIIRGGENVYPLEVENVLATHPGVAAAAVVGVPDSRLGENLAAFIVTTDPERPPDHEELRSFVRSRLAGFKVPTFWYDVAGLPLNHAGKVNRAALRTRHEA